jgi:tetratricopeptide (TPR) repeat protein
MKKAFLKALKQNGRVASGILVLAFAMCWPIAKLAAAAEPNPELEKAVLAEDWKAVLGLTVATGGAASDAVHRFLAGHACLALNRNNESVRLFHDTGKNEDSAQWAAWTKALENSHPTSAVVAYLRGDSLARLGKYDQAFSSFSESLRRSPQHAMSLNARAVCFSAENRWNEAIVDLDDAARANPKLADIHANRGTVNIRRSLGASGALRAFDEALIISPEFVLAEIGRASALFALGKWSDAQDLLVECKLDPDSGYLAAMNAAMMRNAASSAEIAALTSSAPGVAIERAARLQQQKLESVNQQILNDDMGRVGHTFVADSFRDMGQLVKPFTDTFRGIMDFSRGNYGAGAAHLGSVTDTIGGNERTLAGLHDQSAKQGMQSWNKGISELQSIRGSGLQGGIATEDIRRGFIDKGDWRLLARFALQYPEAIPTRSATTNVPSFK